jgi:hypothetical protein
MVPYLIYYYVNLYIGKPPTLRCQSKRTSTACSSLRSGYHAAEAWF